MAPATGKSSVFIQIPKKGISKECSNYCTTVLISHASKVMQKSFKLGFNSTWTENSHIYKLGLEKAEEPEILNHKENKGIPEKYLLLLHWSCYSLFVDHNKLWKILKEMGIPDHLPCLLRNLYAGQESTIRTVHGTTDWFKIEKRVSQGCVLSPCLFNF